MLLTDEELVVHLFVRLDDPRAAAAYQRLCEIWSDCRLRLGTNLPIRGVNLPTQPPGRLPRPAASSDVAAMESQGANEQVILRQDADQLCLSVIIAPPAIDPPEQAGRLPRMGENQRSQWAVLERRWLDVLGPDGAEPLEETRLYLAKTSTPATHADLTHREFSEQLRGLPPGTPDGGWWRRGVRVADGLAMWEISRFGAAVRQIVVVAEQDRAADLGSWTWSTGDLALPPLAAYLLHAAWLRAEQRAWDQGEPDLPRGPDRLRRLRAASDGMAAALAGSAIYPDGTRTDPRGGLRPAVSPASLEKLSRVALVGDDFALAQRLIRRLDEDATRQELLAAQSPAADRLVFVVHGRDSEVRRAMFDFLRALDLKPLEWEPLVGDTGNTLPFLGDVIALALSRARAVVVLLTPDDIVTLHPDLRLENDPDHEAAYTGQPRPNVLLELGMALMAFPERTIVVEVGKLRPISDLGGRNVIRFNGSDDALGKLVERLKLAGCALDDRGSDWRDRSRFDGLAAYVRSPPPAPPVDASPPA